MNKITNNSTLVLVLILLAFTSCKKQIANILAGGKDAVVLNQFNKFTINKGSQFSDRNGYAKVSYEEQKFIVRFDSSAIYSTISDKHQLDINKLYGFSDNNSQHHEYSARFGWRWSNNALQLFAYVYNNGTVSHKELGTVAIGQEHQCSIRVSGNQYIFTLNGQSVTIPRLATTSRGEGYRLFPYFGGSEVAPQTIFIWIKEVV
jgi:hypothetical protein